MTDNFKGDNAKLVECINALLELDASGNLAPHGIGGSARSLLEASSSRIAALAQQAGADYKHVATISQTKFGSYWIDWHEKVAYRKGLKLFASSGPGGGGEGG